MGEEKKDSQETIRKDLERQIRFHVENEQVYLPARIGSNGNVYIEPLDYINTPRGIVLKPGSGHSP